MSSGIFNGFFNSFLDLIDKGGYLGVFLLSIIDRAAMNLAPAEIILPFIGVLVGQGRFDFWLVILIITFGGLIGDIILFWISQKGGRWLIERFGKYFFISRQGLEKTEKLFERHGSKLVLFGRILPPIRTFIAIPAGISNMNLFKFSLYTLIGSLPWTLALIYIGMEAGQNVGLVVEIFDRFQFLAASAAIIIIVWYFYRRSVRRRRT